MQNALRLRVQWIELEKLEHEARAHTPQATRTPSHADPTPRRTRSLDPQERTGAQTHKFGAQVNRSLARLSSGPLPVGGHDTPHPTPSSEALGRSHASPRTANLGPATAGHDTVHPTRSSETPPGRQAEVENQPNPHLPCGLALAVSTCVARSILSREIEASLEHCASVSRRYMLGRARGNSPSAGLSGTTLHSTPHSGESATHETH